MSATLPSKVAFRAEHTGIAAQDRAQRMAQQVGAAHEQTKNIVGALANQSYTALTADTTIAATTYATLLTARITTVLATGNLVITATASCVKTTALGGAYFQVLLDGVVVKGAYATVGISEAACVVLMVRVAVSRGTHTVALQWKTSANSLRINASSVVEEHAHLLVQEAL